jgi:hypothetical protein
MMICRDLCRPSGRQSSSGIKESLPELRISWLIRNPARLVREMVTGKGLRAGRGKGWEEGMEDNELISFHSLPWFAGCRKQGKVYTFQETRA